MKVLIGKYQVDEKLLYEYLESVKKIVSVGDSWVLIDKLNQIRCDRHHEIMESPRPQLLQGVSNAYGIESARFKRHLANWLTKELEHDELYNEMDNY